MAKKVRKDGERKEEKKVVFEPPEFNEREYLTEQLYGLRLNLLFVFMGIPMGFLWANIAAFTGSTILGLGIVIGVYSGAVYGLRLGMGIDILTGPKKTIASTFLMFIFTALAFSVLFSNPPVMDNTPPSITDVMVDFDSNLTDDGEWDILMRHKDNLYSNKSNRQRIKDNKDQTMFLNNESINAEVGDELAIMIKAADASGLRGVWLEYGYDTIDSVKKPMVRLTEAEWKVMGDGKDYTLVGEHYYQYRLPATRSGNLYYRIIVEDMAGHTKTFETKVSEDSIYIAEPTPET